MDCGFLCVVNWLVGNVVGVVGIEVVLGGFELFSYGDMVMVVIGVNGLLMFIVVDGWCWLVLCYVLLVLFDGDWLLFGELDVGVCSYVVVCGGFDCLLVLGSFFFDILVGVGFVLLVVGDCLFLNMLYCGFVG